MVIGQLGQVVNEPGPLLAAQVAQRGDAAGGKRISLSGYI
jgi:hypothetical protein